MTCRNTETQLDEYLDGTLDGDASRALERHANECSDCGRSLDQAVALKATLADLPVEGPTAGFFDEALRVTAAQSQQVERSKVAPVWYAGALAAGLAAIVLVSLLGNPVAPVAPAQGVAQVAMAIEETRTINLVFASDEALEGVSLTVLLPDGVELASYPGQDRVLWSTQLRPGKNVLPLELVALGGTGGELVATMRRDGKEKVFRVNIAVLTG
jgi:hypothetical protein